MENTPKITGVADVDLEAVESEETRAETIQSTGKSEIEGQIDHVEPEQAPTRIMMLVMLSMFQGYASMVGPLQSAYKHELGVKHGTASAHIFTQAAVGVHYGKLIARLGHNIIFACISPRSRVMIAMVFMFVGVLIPPLLVFTLEWHWVYSVFIAYILSGLGLGIFEVTFLSVITPLGKATKSWAIIGCPAGFGTINILGLTLSSFGLPVVWLYWPLSQHDCEVRVSFGLACEARRWMPGMAPFFLAQFLSHFAMENWPAIFYMFHPPKVPLFNPESSDYLMDWGQLALLGLAMGLIIAGLYLESLAIAIIIPLAIFMIFWGNGTIYGLTANHVDKQVPPEHNLASYSCWCFIGSEERLNEAVELTAH
eukprot:g8775.t1